MPRPKGSKNKPKTTAGVRKIKSKPKVANEVTKEEYEKMQKESILENTLAAHIRDVGLPKPEREYKFYPGRRWRFDFCWPDLHVAVECHGGTHTGKGHVSNTGFRKDREKINHAQTRGWKVYEFTSEMIMDGSAVNFLEFFVFKI